MSHLLSPPPRSVGRPDLNRLMLYHDRQFVEMAYSLILGRAADEEGLAHYLKSIRSGESRREVAFRIGNSAEARDRGFDMRLFNSYRVWRRIERIPVLGTLCLIFICLIRFKHVVREFRRLQNAVFGGHSVASNLVSK